MIMESIPKNVVITFKVRNLGKWLKKSRSSDFFEMNSKKNKIEVIKLKIEIRLNEKKVVKIATASYI